MKNLTLMLVFVGAHVAQGCSCSQASVEEYAKWADVVFSGTVQKAEPHAKEKEVVWLYVVPEKQWKGKELSKAQVKIWYHRTCGMAAPASGSKVILYAQAMVDYHHTGKCARYEYSSDDVIVLNKLRLTVTYYNKE